MKRKSFLRSLLLLPFAGYAMKLNQLESLTGQLDNSETMPVLFAGHGSPMNAIEQNEFSRKWQEMGKMLPHPTAILCISAHWETKGTLITAMEQPQTIHDFGGFPQALFDVEYPAPGDPSLAKETASLLSGNKAGLDQGWGLDHGAWSVIKNMYPDADIPVIQLSLDYEKSTNEHYALATRLAELRNKGVLILGSGNMVHNLRMLDWNRPEGGSSWALEANEQFKKLILSNDHKQLMDYKTLGQAVQLSVPTPEHFLPLLYILALKTKDEELSFFNDKAVMGSLTMTSVWIGKGA
jgi:4,5-DOPA dioxygenase extradiol